jgi:hypothetical protein
MRRRRCDIARFAATRIPMKVRAAYNNQVDLMRKSNLFFEYDGNSYLVSQIVIRKSGEDTVYRLYGTRDAESGAVTHSQDVPGDYDLQVKRIIQRPDLFRYFILVSAPILTLVAFYFWIPLLSHGYSSLSSLFLPLVFTVLAILCWQVFRDVWL